MARKIKRTSSSHQRTLSVLSLISRHLETRFLFLDQENHGVDFNSERNYYGSQSFHRELQSSTIKRVLKIKTKQDEIVVLPR